MGMLDGRVGGLGGIGMVKQTAHGTAIKRAESVAVHAMGLNGAFQCMLPHTGPDICAYPWIGAHASHQRPMPAP